MSLPGAPPRAADPIDDPADARLADYRDLRDPELRRRRGIFVAEGRFVVRRLLDGGRFRVRSLLLSAGAREDLADVLGGVSGEVPIFVAPAAVLRQIVGYDFHRGCLAVAERGAPPDIETVLGDPGPRHLLLMDGLTDPDNVGTAFRNAMAFGIDGVILSADGADPLYRKTIRASSGATLTLPFVRVADWLDGLARTRRAGYYVIGLTPDTAATDIADLGVGGGRLQRAAVVVGTEGAGLRAGTREALDLAVRIPMAAGVDSLNVATACGIALHLLRRAASGAAPSRRAPLDRR